MLGFTLDYESDAKPRGNLTHAKPCGSHAVMAKPLRLNLPSIHSQMTQTSGFLILFF